MFFPRWITAMAAVTLVTAFAARAEEPTAQYDPKIAFDESDENKDGKIDPAELYGRLTEVFYLNDANRDGFLDATEYGAAIARPGSFDQTDTNHDGKISLQEFYRDRATLWEQADTDDDQALTFEEVEQAWTPAKPQ
jgi:Ca2+-binding EF-hand superfamily protein